MRGGTSKCWLFDAEDIAAARVDRDTLLAAAFGAADPRQIDGVGGATSTTSKAVIVGRSEDPPAMSKATSCVLLMLGIHAANCPDPSVLLRMK